VKELAGAAFLTAAAVHAGFQATVTSVVYPTLSHVRPAHWRQAHDRQVRAVRPLVLGSYVALAATAVWWLVVDWSVLAAVAVALAGLAMAVTVLVAVPAHRRLVRRDEQALTRLLAADRARTLLAFASVACALVALFV
jgi:hypothetical protein